MDKDATPLIRPLYFGPLVVVLTGFHCTAHKTLSNTLTPLPPFLSITFVRYFMEFNLIVASLLATLSVFLVFPKLSCFENVYSSV